MIILINIVLILWWIAIPSLLTHSCLCRHKEKSCKCHCCHSCTKIYLISSLSKWHSNAIPFKNRRIKSYSFCNFYFSLDICLSKICHSNYGPNYIVFGKFYFSFKVCSKFMISLSQNEASKLYGNFYFITTKEVPDNEQSSICKHVSRTK